MVRHEVLSRATSVSRGKTHATKAEDSTQVACWQARKRARTPGTTEGGIDEQISSETETHGNRLLNNPGSPVAAVGILGPLLRGMGIFAFACSGQTNTASCMLQVFFAY